MTARFIIPALLFTMKYFFDIEKEITQSLIVSGQLRLMECKSAIAHVYQVLISNRLEVMS